MQIDTTQHTFLYTQILLKVSACFVLYINEPSISIVFVKKIKEIWRIFYMFTYTVRNDGRLMKKIVHQGKSYYIYE